MATKWHKFGPWNIKEGGTFMLIGNDVMGYSIITLGEDVKVSKDFMSYSPESFFGHFDSRSEADKEFKMMESAILTPGQVYATELELHHDPTSEMLIYSKGELEKVVSKPTASPYHEELGMRHAKIVSREGSVLAFPTEFPESAVHEYGHYYLGKHGSASEMDVVKFEVEELVRAGKWNSRYKQYTIHSLATHIANLTRRKRVTKEIIDRARKVVNRVEKKALAEDGTIRLPKEVIDLLE